MPNRTTAGIFYLCLGVLVFSLQDAVIKAVSGGYPLTQVVITRSIVAIPILAAMVHVEVGLAALLSRNARALLVRAAIMFAAYSSYYLAFPALPLADAVALYFTVPVFVVLLAAPMLGERTGLRGALAIALGFVGVVVMMRPGAGVFEPAAFLSLFSAAAYALSMLYARRLGGQEAASVMAFYQNGLFLIGAGLVALVIAGIGVRDAGHPSLAFLLRPWVWPTLQDFALLASCGVISAIGTVFLTRAYAIGKAGIVATFEYTGILWAPLWGFLFFAEIPQLSTFAGALLIIAAGLFAMLGGRRGG